MSHDTTPEDHAGEDYYGTEDSGERRDFEHNIKSKATWLRLFFMLVSVLLFWVASIVAAAVILIQFFWVLFTGETKPELKLLGRQLAAFAAETCLYLTFNSEERPFPFDRPWPSGTSEE